MKQKSYFFDLTLTLSTISMWFGFVVIDVISKPLASLMTKITMMMIITKMKMVKMIVKNDDDMRDIQG